MLTRIKFFELLLCTPLFATAALAASSISGTVTNRTNGKPAAGDDVTLIRLAQGMQEAGHAKTDGRGRFTLSVPDEGIHLVRVTHDKANYFQPVEPGQQTADVDVFTAAPKVDGVVSEAEVLHVQSDPGGNALNVVASFFLKNTSSPPRTQFSDKAFEFYLPPGAVVEGSVALGPGRMSMPVKSAPVPLGDADHYALIFPIRPCVGDAAQDPNCGETRFQVSYRLPYSGTLALVPRVAMPTDTVAVMLPKSMTFKPEPGAKYTQATDEVNAQAYVSRNVQPSQPLGFTVAGTGQLPRDSQAQAGGAGQPSAAANGGGDVSPAEASARQRADTKPGVGLNNPLDSEGTLEPWAKYKWWILGGLGLALAAGAGIMMKGGAPRPGSGPIGADAAPTPVSTAVSASAPSGRGAVLQALKDELFALETDRLSGRLTEAEYAEQRSALEVVLRRAMARAGEGV
ncbi:MAG: hypothetical protein NVSMB62_12950 [Acidobacteriaceae bacterium]